LKEGEPITHLSARPKIQSLQETQLITFDFSGRVAIVTGAGGGIGYEIAHMILEAGGSVIMIDVKPEPDHLPGDPEQRLYAQGDITDAGFVGKTIEDGAKRFGRIDYLCNVAGVLWFGKDASLLDMDMDVWDRVFDINIKSMVHTARAAVPHMKTSGGGAMVHFSTVQCLRGDAAPQDAYSTSKAGVGALSRSLAMQLAADGIRSNAVYPGPSQTPMQGRWDSAEKVANVANHIPLGRVGTATDLANATLFLLSDGASFITGTDLIVDGGLLLH